MEETQFSSDDDRTQVDEEEEDYSDIALRLYDISDIDDYMAWATDENVCNFVGWNPTTYASKQTTTAHFLDHIIPHPWFRAVCLNHRAIREILVTPIRGNNRCIAEVGYSLASKYWGKGIMTRALKMVASTIFIDWAGLEGLEALVDVENPASQRVLEKAGFQREGVLRRYLLHKGKPIDMVMFSLLPSDPSVKSLSFHYERHASPAPSPCPLALLSRAKRRPKAAEAT